MSCIENNIFQKDKIEQSYLGDYIGNSYTISNIELAYKILYQKEKKFNANNLYVRFLPKDANEYVKLEEQYGFSLFNYPLDFKYIEKDIPYHDPSLNNDQITWQYIVVPIKDKLPRGIKTEILSSIYLPSAKEIELEEQARKQVIPNYTPNTERSQKRGSVYVIDNSYPEGDGRRLQVLPFLYVRIGHDLRYEIIESNEQGFYQTSMRFDNSADTDIKFSNVKASMRTSWFSWSNAYHRRIYANNTPALGINIFPPEYNFLWQMSIAWVAINNFWKYCEQDGISLPPNNTNIWIKTSDSPMGSGSAHMINKSHLGLHLSEWAAGMGAPLAVMADAIAPDVILEIVPTEKNSIYISSLMFHELTHASHYSYVGNDYWYRLADGEIMNQIQYGDSYYNCNGYEKELIKLEESYANYREDFLLNRKYGIGMPLDIEIGCKYSNNLIPHLFNDLTDYATETDTIPNNLGCTISDYSNNPIISERDLFLSLTPTTYSFTELKPKLDNAIFGNLTGFWRQIYYGTYIDKLFQSYGY